MPIAKKNLPSIVRQAWDAARKAEQTNREAQNLRLKFYVGGEMQWLDSEVQKRKNSQRPILTFNKCRPAVDQIEGDIRINPPGPQCYPVGGSSDGDIADIMEGLIRETEYRSGAKVAYATAGKYVAAGGCAYIELETQYVGDRSFDQQLVVKSIEDPNSVFFDANSRMANRQDASHAGKLNAYSRASYIAKFGENRKVLKERRMQSAYGWIGDALGYPNAATHINEWTGNGDGPYYVCEFYEVEIERKKLTLYTDNITRFDDEPVPDGVGPMQGPQFTRDVPTRKIIKHVVDAFEELDEPTEWLGTLIPLFPVLGPEVYIDGKLYRLSLIAGAIDPQRALNYVGTTATELAGLMPKAPFIGPAGSFADPRWLSANSETWPYLEYTPVLVTDDAGNQTMAPAPQRNHWEAPIQWLLQLGQYFEAAIESVTGTYAPSLGKPKTEQSGVAIEQLRSESNVGNFSYVDNLHRAIEVMYQQMAIILPKILDGPRVVTIVKPDSTHEAATINQIFGEGGVDPATGKPGKPNNLADAQLAVRLVAAKSFETRQQEAIPVLAEFFSSSPAALAVPGVAAKFLRMIGQGNPQVEGMADLLAPPSDDGGATPAQMQQQIAQLKAQNQQITQLAQQLKQEMDAKLPQVEADKFKTLLDNLTKIYVAEVNASKATDLANADNEARQLEKQLGMAHDSAAQAVTGEQQQQTQERQIKADKESQAVQGIKDAISQAKDHQQAKDMAKTGKPAPNQ